MNVEEQAQKITLINNINAMRRTIGISEHDFDPLDKNYILNQRSLSARHSETDCFAKKRKPTSISATRSA